MYWSPRVIALGSTVLGTMTEQQSLRWQLDHFIETNADRIAKYPDLAKQVAYVQGLKLLSQSDINDLGNRINAIITSELNAEGGHWTMPAAIVSSSHGVTSPAVATVYTSTGGAINAAVPNLVTTPQVVEASLLPSGSTPILFIAAAGLLLFALMNRK